MFKHPLDDTETSISKKMKISPAFQHVLSRPPLEAVNFEVAIIFQNLEMDCFKEKGKIHILSFGVTKNGNSICCHIRPLETAHADVEKFMMNSNIKGCCWLELPAGTYKVRDDDPESTKITRCQLEVDIDYNNLIVHSYEEFATFKILSFDLECMFRPQANQPDTKIDAVLQIANVVQNVGEDDRAKVIFTLGTCAPIENAEVRSFAEETEMLDAWANFVRELDPDILTGYNINKFDLPYLLNRAKHLNVNEFGYLGRIKNIKASSSEPTFRTTPGKNWMNIIGRVEYDMSIIVKRDFSPTKRFISLNNISQQLLGEGKENVPYRMIPMLQKENEMTRRRLAVYCLKDAELPLLLMSKKDSLKNDISKSRTTGKLLKDLVF